MKFNELGLSEKVLQAVEASGYTAPTPIQAQAIPHALAGRDVLGIAQTGTGKTAAFTLPMLSRLESGRARARMPRTLILEPTRELAAQVEESFVKYGAQHKLNVALLIGGMSFGDQETKIMRGADVLIATPGRLIDFFERGKLLLTGIEILVIDEADRMLDMGFIPDIEKICKLVPFTRQTLFFSATMPPEITRLTEQFLHNPVRIEVERASSTAHTITQGLVASHGQWAKRETLRKLIRAQDNFKNAIIFCNRKRDVAILHKSLTKHGFSTGALHGDMDQHARMASLDAFKSGEVAFIVCSDVAARGLDIPDVSHVFNFDVPTHAEDYVHRIGRTGRAGKSGVALTIVTDDDRKYVDQIAKIIGKPIEWIGATIDELGPDENLALSRVRRGRSAGEGRGGRARGGRFEGRRGGQGVKDDAAPGIVAEDVDLAASSDHGGAAEPPVARRSRRRGGAGRKTDDSASPRIAASDEIRASVASEYERTPISPRRARPDRPTQAAPRAARYGDIASQASRGQPGDLLRAPRRDGRQPEHGRRMGRRDDHNALPVIGMGDHTPSFLLRPVRLPNREQEKMSED